MTAIQMSFTGDDEYQASVTIMVQKYHQDGDDYRSLVTRIAEDNGDSKAIWKWIAMNGNQIKSRMEEASRNVPR